MFLGLLLYYFGTGQHYLIGVAAVACMILGLLVSYIRAWAESAGYNVNTGIAERPERVALTLLSTGLVALGLPETTLLAALALLAAASAITVTQRIRAVVRQSECSAPEPAG